MRVNTLLGCFSLIKKNFQQLHRITTSTKKNSKREKRVRKKKIMSGKNLKSGDEHIFKKNLY